jgi:peptidoglycan hydrolase-like protein with peptidoglycan-binding domain
MIRSLALVSTLAAASLSAGALSAQATAAKPPKPAAAPAMKHVSVPQDSDTKVGVTAAKPQTAKPAAAKSQAPAAHHAAWTKDQIKEAQEGLAKMGLYHGKATGVFSKATSKALRAYQKRNQLPVTGKLSDDVLTKLKSA